MTLYEWIETQPAGVITRLARAADCANSTIHDIVNGKPLRKFDLAERVSAATGGAVSAVELCTADPLGPKRVAARRRAEAKKAKRSSARAA